MIRRGKRHCSIVDGRNRSYCLAAAVAIDLVALPCLAQQAPPDEGPPIVVTASRTGADARSTQRIDADDIARLQAPTLLAALNDVGGVRAVSSGGLGAGSIVSIRGGEPNFTLVLIDGIRVNNSTNAQGGAFDVALIDPSLVGAIEVNRGPASAVQGSDALSGVINLRLRDPVAGAATGSGRATVGSGGELGISATLAHGWDGGGVLLGGSLYDSGNADRGSDLDRRQGIARLRQRIGGFDATALGLYAHSRHSEFPQDSGGPLLARDRDRQTGTGRLWTAALALRRSADASVRPNVSLSWSSQRDDTVTPAIPVGVLSGVPAVTAQNRLARFEGIADVTAQRGWLTATAGMAVLRERARSTGTIDFGFLLPTAFRLDRNTVSGFAEASARPGAGLTIDLAGRHDVVKNGPREWTGRAGLSWQPVDRAPIVFASIGEGFKLPSFYGLGNPLVGNPLLRPERSRNREAGVSWAGATGTGLRVAWFDTRFRDLIDFDATSFTIVNRQSVRARGIEADARWRIAPALDMAGAVTHVTLDSATPLRNRPKWQGNLRAAWRVMPTIELNAAARFNDSFFDSSVPTGLRTTAGHVEGDIGARWQITTAVGLAATLRNVGNNRSWTAVGYPALRRQLLLTATATAF